MKNQKLILLGIDGGTYKLLKPWAYSGELPSLKKIFEEGSHGTLMSSMPPITGPAWASLATGKNPGKTGIFDFFNKLGTGYQSKMINSSEIRGECFWDSLSSNGYSVAVIAYPMLYPTYEVNGVMVSGFGSVKTKGWVCPRNFEKKINELSPNYDLGPDKRNYNNWEEYLEHMQNLFQDQERVVTYILEEDNPDCFVYVLSMTDWIQHLFWRELDSVHPTYYTKEASVKRKKILELYKKFDRFIGKLIEKYGNERDILIVSDHGFGPKTGNFNLIKWMESEGYLKLKKSDGVGGDGGQKTYSWLRNLMDKVKLKERIPWAINTILPFLRHRFSPISATIDFKRSKTYFLNSASNQIFINLKGREEQGIVEKDEYRKLKGEIVRKLEKLPEQIDGIDSLDAYDAEDIYHGERAALAPDITLKINNWACGVSTFGKARMYEDIRDMSFPNSIGSHRSEGIILAYGPSIKEGCEIPPVKITDIAPTILQMFGVKTPSDMDGTAIVDMFRPESGAASKFVETSAKKELSKKDLGKIKKLRFQLKKN